MRQATQGSRVAAAATPERSWRIRGRSGGAEQEKILGTEAARGDGLGTWRCHLFLFFFISWPLDLWWARFGGLVRCHGRRRRRKKQRAWESGDRERFVGHGGPRSGHTSSRSGERVPKRGKGGRRLGMGGCSVLCYCKAWSKRSSKVEPDQGLVSYFSLKPVYCKHFNGTFFSWGEMNFGKKRR
jgi:hypothetical protein